MLELEGRRVELQEGEATLGRSRGCTVTLRDPSASRNHAMLVVQPGDVRVRDLESSNGTYVNGERLDGERPIADGDRITIGETEIVVHVTAPPEDVGATVRLDAGGITCPSCGAELPVHAEVCPRCRHRLGSPVGQQVPSATTPIAAEDEPGPPPPPAPPAAGGRTEIYREPVPVAPPQRPADHTLREPVERPQPPLPPPPRADLPPAVDRAPSPARPGAAGPAPAAAGGLRPAGFGIRLAAVLIDAVWIWALTFLASFPFGGPLDETGALVAVGVSFLLSVGVPVVGWAIWGTTPGKAVLKLYVTADGKVGIGLTKALLRYVGYWVSGAIAGIGFLMIAFTADKRGLHDMLAGTSVGRR